MEHKKRVKVSLGDGSINIPSSIDTKREDRYSSHDPTHGHGHGHGHNLKSNSKSHLHETLHHSGNGRQNQVCNYLLTSSLVSSLRSVHCYGGGSTSWVGNVWVIP